MASSEPSAGPDSFESALQRLAEIVAGLESGSLGLSESIAAYERGVGILKRLHEELAQAEERVKVLVRIDDEGRPVLEDPTTSPGDARGDGEAAGSAQPAPSRPARGRVPKPRQLPGMDDAGAG